MKIYNICFVGLGSIAKRHIDNVSNYLERKGVAGNIDVLRSGKGDKIPAEIKEKLRHIYYDAESIKNKYDIIFVTNPTIMHVETLNQLQDKTSNFFVEKPLFHNSDIAWEKKPGTLYYIACPLRYSRVIQYLKKSVDFSKVINIRAISSSYLPAWRPDSDYRESYSARSELGGGVSIDLIHEWDYITYLAGMPGRVLALMKRVSGLEIDSDDIAVYIGEYEDKIVELHLDYFTQNPVRQVVLTTDKDVIQADLINSEINYINTGETIDLNEERNECYIKEIEYFFDIIEGRKENSNDTERALQTLRLAEGKYR